MRRRKVYIAAPYSNGDKLNDAHVSANVKVALATAAQLINMGFDAFAPHTSHYVAKELRTISYERWMEWCINLLDDFDCVLRLKGASKGADAECLYAVNRCIPVYTSVKELVEKES